MTENREGEGEGETQAVGYDIVCVIPSHTPSKNTCLKISQSAFLDRAKPAINRQIATNRNTISCILYDASIRVGLQSIKETV